MSNFLFSKTTLCAKPPKKRLMATTTANVNVSSIDTRGLNAYPCCRHHFSFFLKTFKNHSFFLFQSTITLNFVLIHHMTPPRRKTLWMTLTYHLSISPLRADEVRSHWPRLDKQPRIWSHRLTATLLLHSKRKQSFENSLSERRTL